MTADQFRKLALALLIPLKKQWLQRALTGR
jgi:hypothetical protein